MKTNYNNRMMNKYHIKDNTEYFNLIAKLVSLVDVDDIEQWKCLLRDIDTINENIKWQKQREKENIKLEIVYE